MQNKRYELPCPVCGVTRVYKNYKSMASSRRQNCICRNCAGHKRLITYHKDIPTSWFSMKRAQAKIRKKPWRITITDLQEVYEKQGKVCALTKLPIGWGKPDPHAKLRELPNRYSVSIDRIDSKRGYFRDNIQLVHKTVNIMKHKVPMREFVHFCKLVYLTNKHLVDD